MTALKLQNNRDLSEETMADPNSTAIGFMSMEEADRNERILPSPDNATVPDSEIFFEEGYANFQRMIRDLADDHEREGNALLDLNDLLATAHAETLEDQADLAMFLGDIRRFNADLDDQIREYEAFLSQNTSPGSE